MAAGYCCFRLKLGLKLAADYYFPAVESGALVLERFEWRLLLRLRLGIGLAAEEAVPLS